MKFDIHDLVIVEGQGKGTVWNYDRRNKEYEVIISGHRVPGVKEDQMQLCVYDGNSIFFVNAEHETYYKRTLRKWVYALKDVEYQTACYILSVPMIFEKVEHLLFDFEKPVDWIWRYLKWSEEYKEEWESYNRRYDYEKYHPDYEKWIAKKPFDLSSSMVQLGKFSLNLWNSSNESNLMNCLGVLDQYNFDVLKCAIDMRMGKFKGR